jgi:hypothetical protein
MFTGVFIFMLTFVGKPSFTAEIASSVMSEVIVELPRVEGIPMRFSGVDLYGS